MKLQPMPLPQGMTPSSTEIIASLNEHLVQVLQVGRHRRVVFGFFFANFNARVKRLTLLTGVRLYSRLSIF